MSDGPDRNEIDLGLREIETWPIEERRAAARLPRREQELIVLGAALFHMRPGSPECRPQDVIEIDWRGWKAE